MEKRGKVLELGVSGNVETAYGLFADLFVHVAGGFEHAVDHVGVVGVAEDLDVLPIIKIIKRKCGADADQSVHAVHFLGDEAGGGHDDRGSLRGIGGDLVEHAA